MRVKELKRISLFRGDYVNLFRHGEEGCEEYDDKDLAYGAASSNNRAIFERLWGRRV